MCLTYTHTYMPHTHTYIYASYTHIHLCLIYTHTSVPHIHTYICASHTHIHLCLIYTHTSVPHIHTYICASHTHIHLCLTYKVIQDFYGRHDLILCVTRCTWIIQIWMNKSLVNPKSTLNPKSTSNQSSKPCTVLQYPSRNDSLYMNHSNLKNDSCISNVYGPTYLPVDTTKLTH